MQTKRRDRSLYQWIEKYQIRSSVILVQLPMDYYVQLNVFLQLYNQMHMHVLQDIDVHYKMNFHIYYKKKKTSNLFKNIIYYILYLHWYVVAKPVFFLQRKHFDVDLRLIITGGNLFVLYIVAVLDWRLLLIIDGLLFIVFDHGLFNFESN